MKELSAVKSTLSQRFFVEEKEKEEGFLGFFSTYPALAVSAVTAYTTQHIRQRIAGIFGLQVDEFATIRELKSLSEKTHTYVGESVMGTTTRFKREKNSVTASIELTLAPSTDLYSIEDIQSGQMDYQKLIAGLETIFGKSFLDFEQPVDMRIPAVNVFNNPTVSLEMLAASGIDADDLEDYFKPILWPAINKCVKSIRLVSPALVEKDWPSTYVAAEGKYMGASSIATWRGDARGFLAAALNLRKLHVFIEVSITPREVEFLTQTPFAEAKMGTLAAFVCNTVRQDIAPGAKGASTWYISPVSQISKANKEQGDSLPQTSEEGLVITQSGGILYIPTIDNAEKYEQDVEAFGQRQDSNEYCLRDALNPENMIETNEIKGRQYRKQRQLPTNTVIYTDWVNNRLAYTDGNGMLTTFDLAMTNPAKKHVVLSILSNSVGSNGTNDSIMKTLTTLFARLPMTSDDFLPTDKAVLYDTVMGNESTYSVNNAWDQVTAVTEGTSVSRAIDQIASRMRYVARHVDEESTVNSWVHEHNSTQSFTMDLLDENSAIPAMRPFGRHLLKIRKLFDENPVAFLSERGVINCMQEAALLISLTTYMGKKSEVVRADNEERSVYKDVRMDPDFVVTAIPMVKDLVALPHQVKSLSVQAFSPQNLILDAQPGAGKTILALLDILLNLGKGTFKRPMIACPGHLVKDYVKEANFVTKGRLNMVPVTSATLKSWGEDRLFNLIMNAPINTVVVTDYDFIKGRSTEVVYGNAVINVGQNAELLRSLDRDAIYLDESHWLKNESGRNRSVARLLSGIKYRRELTGTFIADTLLDIVKQVALLDASIFGNQDRFKDDFAAETRGNKVVSWIPGAEAEVANRLRQHSQVVVLKRKEWAALLPPRHEEFIFVELSPSQRAVYQAILEETIEAIKKDPKLIEMLKQKDEDLSDEITAALNPYLARIERFLTAPMADPAAAKLLTGEDAVGPKVKEAINRIYEHKRLKIVGKIIVFSQYKESARILYESLPPDLKKRAVLYTSSNKVEDTEKFEFDDNIDILIGVETSLNTGGNLQHASRIIRLESVWSPGSLEQAESRINRPQLKRKELRTALYYDWIVCNRSIDVTKVGRLISKIISKSKFDEHTNAAYQMVPDVELIGMSLENIQSVNDFSTSVSSHLDAFQNLKQVEQADYDQWKANPRNKTQPVKIPDGDILPGSKLMKHIPYIAGMDIYGADKLGLTTYSEYLRNNKDEEFDPVDLQVHTEWGDGTCIGAPKNKLRIRLASDDSVVNVDKLASFIITRDQTSTKSIRSALLGITGLKGHNVDLTLPAGEEEEEPLPIIKRSTKAPVEEITPPSKLPKKPVPNTDTVKNKAVNLYLTIVNNAVAIGVDTEDPDSKDLDLAGHGFKKVMPYMYAWVKTAKHLEALIAKFEENFEVSESYMKPLRDALNTFEGGKRNLLNVKMATNMEWKNFFRMKFKAAGTKELKPYPVLQDGDLYICCDLKSQPAAKRLAAKALIPGVKWELDDDSSFAMVPTKAAAKALIEGMEAQGITLINKKQIIKEFNEIKLIKKG